MKFKPKPIPLRMPSWESTELPQQEAGFVPTHHAYPETPLWCPTGAFQGLTEQILLTALPTPPHTSRTGPGGQRARGRPPSVSRARPHSLLEHPGGGDRGAAVARREAAAQAATASHEEPTPSSPPARSAARFTACRTASMATQRRAGREYSSQGAARRFGACA